MSWKLDRVHESPLRPARTDEEYLLHEAALEWGLIDPIVIRSPADIQSAATWRDRLEPFAHQVQNLMTFCRRLPVTLVADDVGLGKTISAGLVLSELMARKRVRRALVLCPKILGPQWVDELDEKFGIVARCAVGGDLESETRGGAAVVVSTYQSATKRLGQMPADAFDLIVLDEAHKLRNPDAQMTKAVRAALARRAFKFVLMLTATPIQNSVWDLYSLIDLLAVARNNQNPFGSSDAFRRTYLKRADGRQLNPATAGQFQRIVRAYMVRTRREDARLTFPRRRIETVRVPLTPPEEALRDVVREHIVGLNALQQTSLAQALMSGPAALAAQLENMARERAALGPAAARAKALAAACPTPAKLQHLLRLIDSLRRERADWRVVVFTLRKETQAAIGRVLDERGTPAGFVTGGQAAQNTATIERFRASPPGLHVLISTDAGAEGINLQACNVLVNYDLPWNPMIVEQRIGRLQRLKSKHETVSVINLVGAGTVEERVVGRLIEKLQVIAQSVGDIESVLESASALHKDQDEERFEKVLRDLVVRSLAGQDVEAAGRLELESIERARVLIEAQRDEMDRALGQTDELHRAGPVPPALARPAPAVPAREFVRRAKQADGRVVREVRPGVFEATAPGRAPERFTFDEQVADDLRARAVFSGPVEYFHPGARPFEHLVQRWIDRCGHRVADFRGRTEALAERLAAAWCGTIDRASLVSWHLISREARFRGESTVRVKAVNGVDSYEKLVAVRTRPAGHTPVRGTAGPDFSAADLTPSKVVSGDLSYVRTDVEADPDVGAFARFYAERRAEELARAGADPHLRRKVEGDFTVAVEAAVVGLQGAAYDEVRLAVRFSVAGGGAYDVQLLAVPASGQILEEPPRAACGETGVSVPVACLGECSVTRRRVLLHLLATSPVSRRRAVRDRFVTCERTGQLVLPDEIGISAVSGVAAVRTAFVVCSVTDDLILPEEAGTSAVSGRLARRDLLAASDRSPNRPGLADEFRTCAATGRRLLADEVGASAASGRVVDSNMLVQSARSGRPALADELVTCAASGLALLPDEVAVCAATGQTVDDRLLTPSAVSGARALLPAMVTCSVTGGPALPGELARCQVTGAEVVPGLVATCGETGTVALKSQMMTCAVGGGWVLASEAGRSDLSGKPAARRHLVRSELPPYRVGLATEAGRCAATGRLLLEDELGISAVSGRRVGRDLLVASARSGRLATRDEMVMCPESKAALLPDETDVCVISGGRVDARLLLRSEGSGKAGLARLMERCAATRRLALPSELEACAVTGDRVLPGVLRACAVTGARVRPAHLVVCQESGQMVLASETGRSGVSGLRVLKSLLRRSDRPPHRQGLAEEMARCEASGRTLLTDELGVSAVSGRRVDSALLVPSAASGRAALAAELVECAESGARLLPAEAAVCAVTGRPADHRLLSAHDLTGQLVLTRLTARCAATGKRVLARELEPCGVTGEPVLPALLETCAISGVRGLRGRMRRSDVSGRYAVPARAFESAVSRKVGLHDEGVTCSWLGRPILRSEAGRCTLTGRAVAKGLLNADRQLTPLAGLLDAESTAARPAPDLLPLLRALDPVFAAATAAVAVPAPGGDVLAVCVEVPPKGWFRNRPDYIGFLLRLGPAPKILGRGVRGHRNGTSEFIIESQLEFT